MSGREGPAPFVEEGISIETISLSWDFTDLWPLAWPFTGGELDRDGFKGVLEASGWAGEGIRFSATVVGLMSSMISRSSSESEEGKKRSGSLFERVGAAGDGEGEKSMAEMSNLSNDTCNYAPDYYYYVWTAVNESQEERKGDEIIEITKRRVVRC